MEKLGPGTKDPEAAEHVIANIESHLEDTPSGSTPFFTGQALEVSTPPERLGVGVDPFWTLPVKFQPTTQRIFHHCEFNSKLILHPVNLSSTALIHRSIQRDAQSPHYFGTYRSHAKRLATNDIF